MSHQLLHDPSITIYLLHKEKAGGRTKKLIVDGRSTEIWKVRTPRKPFPLADTGRKAQEAPLIVADIDPPGQFDRPKDPTIRFGCLEDPTIKPNGSKRNCMK
jgi:hypothetical protein